MNKFCFSCHSTKTYVDKFGYERWNYKNGKIFCNSCGSLIRYYEKRSYFLQKMKEWKTLHKKEINIYQKIYCKKIRKESKLFRSEQKLKVLIDSK